MKNRNEKQILAEKRFDEMTSDALKFVEMFTQDLAQCPDDLTLLTLKGHLVAEHLLETIIARLFGISEMPKNKSGRKVAPGFYCKLKLVEAAVTAKTPGPNADLLIVVEKLNDVRNQLAHNLKNQPEIEKDIRSLINCYHSTTHKKQHPNKRLPGLLRDCLCHLCGFLFGVRKHFYDLELSSGS